MDIAWRAGKRGDSSPAARKPPACGLKILGGEIGHGEGVRAVLDYVVGPPPGVPMPAASYLLGDRLRALQLIGTFRCEAHKVDLVWCQFGPASFAFDL